jgi:hypothetical protein
MAYDYKKKVNKFRSIVQFKDGAAKVVGYICFGGDKGYMRLNSKFIKDKGLMYLQIMQNKTNKTNKC